MKKKINFHKIIIISIILIIVNICIFTYFHFLEYRSFTNNFNNKISAILATCQEKYPDVSKEEIIEILNNDNSKEINDFFEKYGIEIENEAIILENDKEFRKFLGIEIGIGFGLGISLVIVFFIYELYESKELSKITKYVEELNRRNYSLKIDDNSEDELSILKNEIYKTTVMLKETAENSNQDKIKLKESLSDISHQLKTPITSILIMLDNIIDDDGMPKEVREDFIRDIKREISNINFLVQNILKLSKFDANVVEYSIEEIYIDKLIEKVVHNLLPLCDLKNVKIEVVGDKNAKMYGDFMWQKEAILNILKDSIEHSFENSSVIVNFEENAFYSLITIEDFGDGISKEDLPHIFDRFYKGVNSKEDSVGIGLALAKTIIEQDNGKITVTSSNKGTKFSIKYFKR